MSTQHHNDVRPPESWLSLALWTGGALIVISIFGYYVTM